MNDKGGFRDLEIFQLALKLAIESHKMTLTLPKFEMFEEGSQIRRSSKSVVSHIVEGFDRRIYKNDFLEYITGAIAECDETQVHLELIYETGSLKNREQFEYFSTNYNLLGRKLYRFYDAVLKGHISPQ